MFTQLDIIFSKNECSKKRPNEYLHYAQKPHTITETHTEKRLKKHSIHMKATCYATHLRISLESRPLSIEIRQLCEEGEREN